MRDYFLDLVGYIFVFVVGFFLGYKLFDNGVSEKVKTEYVYKIEKSDLKIDSINRNIVSNENISKSLIDKSKSIKSKRDSIKIVVRDTIYGKDVEAISEKISLYEEDLTIKDSIIYVKDLIISDKDNIISEQENKLSIKDDYINSLEKVKVKKKSKIVIGPTIGYGINGSDMKLKPFFGVGLTLNIF